jgi:hypothetical protein
MRNDVVNGFSYSFSAALLKKLKQLKKDRILFKSEFAYEHPTTTYMLTDMAATTVSHLSLQISRHEHVLENSRVKSVNGVDEFILFVEEFLAIFQTKAKKTK